MFFTIIILFKSVVFNQYSHFLICFSILMYINTHFLISLKDFFFTRLSKSCVLSRVVYQVVVRDSAPLLTSGPLTSVILLLFLLCPWAPRWTWVDGSSEGNRKAWTATTLCVVEEWSCSLSTSSALIGLPDGISCGFSADAQDMPFCITCTDLHMCSFVFNFDQIDCTVLLTVFFFFLKRSVNTNIYKFYIYMKNLNR